MCERRLDDYACASVKELPLPCISRQWQFQPISISWQPHAEVLMPAEFAVHHAGVDDADSYEQLCAFVEQVSRDGGVTHFIVHARKCILKGLSPSQNRSVPPIRCAMILNLNWLAWAAPRQLPLWFLTQTKELQGSQQCTTRAAVSIRSFLHH